MPYECVLQDSIFLDGVEWRRPEKSNSNETFKENIDFKTTYNRTRIAVCQENYKRERLVFRRSNYLPFYRFIYRTLGKPIPYIDHYGNSRTVILDRMPTITENYDDCLYTIDLDFRVIG